MIECPSCGRRQHPRLLCESCASPLGVELDCFAALGLPNKLALEPGALERVYHDLSRQIHPDRFAQAPVRARDASLRSTALLTRSYRTLRDPVTRGRYWLEMRGEKLSDDNKQVPPEIAEAVFEVQEQLACLREAVRAGSPEVATMAGELEARRAALLSVMNGYQIALRGNFVLWDLGRSSAQELALELKLILSNIAYLHTLLRDVDFGLENLKAA
ncbi:MAG TPA: hypothetical protein VNF29_13055 [Candidatus Binataceae bacterium]|nr:hypothetical protein [Candidatus Binataceae bacterium]